MGLKMFTRSSDVTSYDLSEYSAVPMIMPFHNQAKDSSFNKDMMFTSPSPHQKFRMNAAHHNNISAYFVFSNSNSWNLIIHQTFTTLWLFHPSSKIYSDRLTAYNSKTEYKSQEEDSPVLFWQTSCVAYGVRIHYPCISSRCTPAHAYLTLDPTWMTTLSCILVMQTERKITNWAVL